MDFENYPIDFSKPKNNISVKMINKEEYKIVEFIKNKRNKSKLEIEIFINEKIGWISILSVICINEEGKKVEFIVTNDPLLLNDKKPYLDKLDLRDMSDFNRRCYFLYQFSLFNNINITNIDNKEIEIKENKLIAKVNIQPIMLMQLKRLKDLSLIYLDEQKRFSFYFKIDYNNNNLLPDSYFIFNYPKDIKEESIELYSIIYNNSNSSNENFLKSFKINLKTKLFSFLKKKKFCDKLIEIKKESDYIKMKVELIKNDLSDKIIEEIKNKKIKISIKLNNENYNEIPISDNLEIEIEIINIYIYFEIKTTSKCYQFLNTRSYGLFSLKIDTLNNKTIIEYNIFKQVNKFFAIFINQNTINNQLKESILLENEPKSINNNNTSLNINPINNKQFKSEINNQQINNNSSTKEEESNKTYSTESNNEILINNQNTETETSIKKNNKIKIILIIISSLGIICLVSGSIYFIF